MVWLSVEDTKARIRHIENPERVLRLYGLARFLNTAFYSANFHPANEWTKWVVLSEAGKELLSQFHKADISFTEHLEIFTLFRLFFYREILIDIEKTDCAGILSSLQNMLDSGTGHWPYVFGNKLYHAFNDSYTGNRTEELDAVSGEGLLRGSPQGVFQIGKLLSGPLGFLESNEDRLIPPTLEVALWHCSDPGCQTRHTVFLDKHKNDCFRAFSSFMRYAHDNIGPRSEWSDAILDIHTSKRWPSGRKYADIPAIIGDCIIGEERSTLLATLLRSGQAAVLNPIIREKRQLSGSPDKVSCGLTPEEQHQLLLLLPDQELVRAIDETVAAGQIKIPPSELRRPTTSCQLWNSRDCRSVLSSLGLRSTSQSPTIEMSARVWNSYEKLGKTEDLMWTVRNQNCPTLRHSVMEFIRNRGPEDAVNELILSSREATAAVGEDVLFTLLPGEEEAKTCQRLLWKLGFNVARYEEDYLLLRNRIVEFRECVLCLPPRPSEHEKALARASGVNLFVSVEQFLEAIVSYNAWLMGSDHFLETKFRYSNEEAMNVVPHLLGVEVRSGDDTCKWSVSGTNPLGVLLAYLQAFRSWLKQRSHADHAALQRSDADYPHYSNDPLCIFPFMHTELWADCSPDVLSLYTDTFDKLCVQLAQAEVPAIRNGLDHKRDADAFPSADSMLACASRLQQVVDLADANRLIPKLFWGTTSEIDGDGNSCDTFADYRQSTVLLWEPSPVLAGPERRFGRPYLIAPFDLLHLPNSMLVFRVSPRTEYSDYWKTYPRRRVISPVKDSQPTCIREDTP
ncbi:MAG: hypothetical protein WC869_01945 [Phycisphaerae bacterium]|jgi:hypothetical protein